MRINTFFFLSIITVLSLKSDDCLAQSPFKAGISLGVNFAQIDGDFQYGYDKVGLGYGLRGGIAVRKNFDIMTELLYVEKGTNPQSSQNYDSRKANIVLKYAEIPLLFSYHYKKSESGFYRITLQTGASYGRLLRSTTLITKRSIIDSVTTASLQQENYRKYDISFIVGFTYNIRHNLGINLRHSVALTTMYNNPNYDVLINTSRKIERYLTFRNYFLSLQVFYDFVAPKIKKPRKKRV